MTTFLTELCDINKLGQNYPRNCGSWASVSFASLLTVHADEARIHKLVGAIRSDELNKPFSSMR